MTTLEVFPPAPFQSHAVEEVGYLWLIRRYAPEYPQLPSIRSWGHTGSTEKSLLEETETGHVEYRLVPLERISSRVKGLPSTALHLRYALRYEGVWPGPLKAILSHGEARTAIEQWIRAQPTSQVARRAWYLAEVLTGYRLDIPDSRSATPLADLANGELQLTVAPEHACTSSRHRVRDNLPGTPGWWPVIRMTEGVRHTIELSETIADRIASILSRTRDLNHESPVLWRALNWLYLGESQSSFAIEREQDDSRVRRFARALQHAGKGDATTEAFQKQLQEALLEPRFIGHAPHGWRTPAFDHPEVYVALSRGGFRAPKIALVGAPSEHNQAIMSDWGQATRRMHEQHVPGLLRAAISAFAFVTIHPLTDGNGRLHRYLLHHFLAEDELIPHGMILPLSAVMLKNMRAYEQALNSLSDPIMDGLHYELDEAGALRFTGDTAQQADLYRYLDATRVCEYMGTLVEETLDQELTQELTLTITFDMAKKRCQEIVDMPDRLLDRFITLVAQNHGHLSKKKRERLFAELTDAEVQTMEQIVQEVMGDAMETAAWITAPPTASAGAEEPEA